MMIEVGTKEFARGFLKISFLVVAEGAPLGAD